MTTVNFAEKFRLFSDHWSPKVIAEMNDYQFKLVKIQGEFVWHDHGPVSYTHLTLPTILSV